MKITKRQLRRIIREAQYGETLSWNAAKRFTTVAQIERDIKSAIAKALKAGLDIQTALDTVVRVTDEYEGY